MYELTYICRKGDDVRCIVNKCLDIVTVFNMFYSYKRDKYLKDKINIQNMQQK